MGPLFSGLIFMIWPDITCLIFQQNDKFLLFHIPDIYVGDFPLLFL